MTYDTTVNTHPGQRSTTEATARPLSRYLKGGLTVDSAMANASAVLAVIEAESRATMMVVPRASARAIMEAITAQIFQARLIFAGSCRSGKKRSKKNPAPKMVATKIPTLWTVSSQHHPFFLLKMYSQDVEAENPNERIVMYLRRAMQTLNQALLFDIV